MKNTIPSLKKTFSIITLTLILCVVLAPAAFAVECDQDKDGYVALTQAMLEEVVLDNTYNANGNYPPVQWRGIFDVYKQGVESDPGLNAAYICDSLNFKKGAEPSRCDQPLVSATSGVYDTAKVSSVSGSKVHPGAFDAPDNGIDEDCDGADGQLLAGDAGDQERLGGLVERAIGLLSKAVVVVSIVILIWGGILYSTAAGDEQKTSKARKAIVGAIIGLAVGLLAPTIVSYITASLV